MENIENVFKFLGTGIHVNFSENKLTYKNIIVEEGTKYIRDLDNYYDDFRLEFQNLKSEIDSFDLLVQITETIDKLTYYYYNEVVFYKSPETEIPELANYERDLRDQFRKNQLHFLEPIILKEISIAKKIKNFIIENRKTISENKINTLLPLKECVRFNGDQSTLITIFYGLQLTDRISLNGTKKYGSEQMHLTDFLQNNFLYRKGTSYEAVKNADKALSDLRQQYENTADVAKDKASTILDDTINFLIEYKAKLSETELRPKVSSKKENK